MSGHFVEVCEIHGTRYGSCRCIGPHETRKVPCQPARCNVTRLPPPPVSAEPRVLLEFDCDGRAMELVQTEPGKRWIVIDGIGVWRDGKQDGLYCSEWSRAVFAVYDAMRAREVRE